MDHLQLKARGWSLVLNWLEYSVTFSIGVLDCSLGESGFQTPNVCDEPRHILP